MLHNHWKQCDMARLLEDTRAWRSAGSSHLSCTQFSNGAFPQGSILGPSDSSAQFYSALDQDLDGLELESGSNDFPMFPDSSDDEGGSDALPRKQWDGDGNKSVPAATFTEVSNAYADIRVKTAPAVQTPAVIAAGRHGSIGDGPLPALQHVPRAPQTAPQSAREHNARGMSAKGKFRCTRVARGISAGPRREPSIVERHAYPEHWYRCNRPYYSSVR